MDLTRRHALAGAAALAATPLLPAMPALAAAPAAEKQAPSFYRYKVGDAQVNVISDGVNNFALGDTFVLNAKKDEVNAALEKAFMPKDKMSIQFAPLAINTGGKLVVIDTGNGPGAFASSKGNVGQFATNLAAAGIGGTLHGSPSKYSTSRGAVNASRWSRSAFSVTWICSRLITVGTGITIANSFRLPLKSLAMVRTVWSPSRTSATCEALLKIFVSALAT